jgi:hypothetical protein
MGRSDVVREFFRERERAKSEGQLRTGGYVRKKSDPE